MEFCDFGRVPSKSFNFSSLPQEDGKALFWTKTEVVNTLSIYLPKAISDKIALVILDASLADLYPQLIISTPLKYTIPSKYVDIDETNNITTYICNKANGVDAYDIINVVSSSDVFEFEVYEGWPWEISEKNLLATYNESNYEVTLPQTFSCNPKTVLLKSGVCSVGTSFVTDSVTPAVNRTGFITVDNAEKTYKFDETMETQLYYTFTPRVDTSRSNPWTMSIESKWNETVSTETISLMSYAITVTLNGTVIVDYKILEQPPLQLEEPVTSAHPEKNESDSAFTTTLLITLLFLFSC